MPTVSFYLSQTDIIAAKNNTIASVDTSDIVPTPDSYFLVSVWNGAIKISESYLPGAVGFGKLLISPILQAYCESQILLPSTRDEANMPYLLLTAKAAYHKVVAGVTTVYNASNIVFNLVLGLVPNLYYRNTVNPNFRNFYSDILNFRYLTYKPDNEVLTATEPSGISVLGVSSNTREGWLDYSNFRIQYFLIFEDYTSETVVYSTVAMQYGSIRNIAVSFEIAESVKTVSKKIISFKVKILAYQTGGDVAISNFRTFNLDTRQYEFERTFCFLNSVGGWEYFSSHEYRKVSNTTKKERFTSFSDLSLAKRVNIDQVINIDSRQKAVINSGVYDRKKIAAIQEIIDSPLVYLVRKTYGLNRDYVAINILSEKIASFDDDDYIDSFSFEYEFNHTETSTQDFLL